VNQKTNNENKKRVYIRPEDIIELILKRINTHWKTIDDIEENLMKMLMYFKNEKYDKLEKEFDLP